MMELSDIRAGLALGTGGLLVLCGWVWQDARERNNRLAPAWAGFVLLTGGLGFLPYYRLTRRKENRSLYPGVLVWMVWLVFLAAGGYATTVLAAGNRQASVGVVQSSPGRPTLKTPNPASGDFDKAFPGPGPGPSPSQVPRR